MIDKRQLAGATLCKFKGSRGSVTTVDANRYAVSSSTNVIGSVFYARVIPGEGQTRLEFVGKPTLDGKEVCSEDDRELDPCEPMTVLAGWSGRAQMTGREEGETIRSVILELDAANP